MMLAPLRQGGSGAGSNSGAYRQQHVLHLIYRREAQGDPQAADKAREAQPSWHQAT